ncbi:MAG TPA: lysylphosphatidylglycerol synthase domain-containing protein [Gemmatimonadaceae bacterium]|nr:lysylphosphatidylglycerol synthase domain-containing protein [Gemmatimonadaceae bacterium]
MRRFLPAVFRLGLLVIAGFFLIRLAREYARGLSGVHFELDAVGLVAATALWLVSYVFLVRLWAGSMTWWGAPARLAPALRVFAAANLARYIPGGIWQFASLAAMSASSGLPLVAVASAAVFQQIVLASTGLILGLAFAPASRLGASWAVPVPVLLLMLALAVAALVLLLPPLTRRIDGWLSSRRKMAITLPRVRRREIAAYVVLSTLGWVGYALAFVLFAHAVLDPVPLAAIVLGASFILSYVAGILAVFAPGGLIVREAALVALVAPALGGEPALALAIASRLWLTLVDAGLSAFMLVRPPRSVDTRLP